MKYIYFARGLCFSFLVLTANFATAETYLSIDYYPVEEEAYNGDTPINSVLRIPDAAVTSTPKCFADIVEGTEGDGPPCPSEWQSFIKQCKAEIKKAIFQTAPKYDEESERAPTVSIARLSKARGAALVVRNYFGGSGGAHYDWSLFLLKWKEKQKPRCPSMPFLAGVEVTPGGNTWVSGFCKNEPYDKCAERIFYPKANAFRLEFTDAGTRVSKIPKDLKLPPPIE